MKRKLILIFLMIVAVFACAFGIAGCSNSDGNGHVHTFSSSWAYDGTYHWHAATCGHAEEVSDKAEHIFKDDVCSVCGYEKVTIPPATKEYIVVYDANGGEFSGGTTTLEQLDVAENSTLTAPVSPTRSGWTFNGWATDRNGSDLWNFASDTVTGNITLYAVWQQQSAEILSVEGATIEGTNIFLLVSPDTNSVPLSDKVVCSSNSIWRLYYDQLGQIEIPTRIAAGTNGSLQNGDNVFYIVVSAIDSMQVNVYELIIHRSYTVSVNYMNGDTVLYTDYAETGTEFTADYTANITGYTFNGWKTSDNTAFISAVLYEPLTLYADKTANTYTVTFKINESIELNQTTQIVTYGDDYSFPVPKLTGYSFSGWYDNNVQLTDGAGNGLAKWDYIVDITLTPRWTANEYILTLNTNNSEAGAVSGGGSHAYNSMVTISATANKGYNFVGWFDDGTLISDQSRYTFTMGLNAVYVAVFELDEALQNFTFEITADSCTITGIKDKTIKEIVVPDYITEISLGAFSGCSSLESITLPFVGKGKNAVGEDADWLFGHIFGTESYTGSIAVTQRYLNYKDRLENQIYYIPSTLRSVTITRDNILYGAFSGCSMLTCIIIPDSVTSISGSAFFDCTSLTSIEIPDTVNTIGSSAFSGCSMLTSIEIPNSVNSIGSSAFFGCSMLTSIEIPNSVNSIGSGAFSGCSSLKSITLPFVGDSIKGQFDEYQYPFGYIFGSSSYMGSIEVSQQYYGYIIRNERYTVTSRYYIPSSLKNVTITGGNILYGAFYNCSSLENIVIPDSVTYIGDYAFYECNSLTSIIIPNGVTSIGDQAFRNCYKLIEVYDLAPRLGINAGSTGDGYVGNYAISVYTSIDTPSKLSTTEDGFRVYADDENSIYYLIDYVGDETEITLPENINGNRYAINQYAFYNRTSLTSVTIPASVTSIGERAFYNCTELEEVYITDIAAWCNIVFKDTYSNPLFYAGKLYLNGELITELVIPDGITEIKAYSFYNCRNLASVIIPEGVTSIGAEAFYDCNLLTSITIGSDVTEIGDAAFNGCNKLIEVCNLSNLNVTEGDSSYGYVSMYAKNVYTSESGLTKLSTTKDGFIVYADEETQEYYLMGYVGDDTTITLPDSINGYSYEIYQFAFINCSSIESITISNKVTSIGWQAFYGCSSLTRINIPDSVTYIDFQAFANCISLTDVLIGSGITSVHNYVFENCSSLERVTIANGTTIIGKYMFMGCTSLENIIIPESVTNIGNSAFSNCTSLKVLYYGSTEDKWENIVLGSSNSSLTNATRYYYSETSPTEDGNFWHYAEDGVTPVVWTKETV